MPCPPLSPFPPSPTFLQSNNSLIGAIVGSLLTIFGFWIAAWYRKPKLVLTFRSSEKFLTESTHTEGDRQNVTRKYLRVRLKNDGRSPARKTCIYLMSIEKVSGDQILPTEFADPRKISWPPHAEFEPRDLPRHLPNFANVVDMERGKLHWNFQIRDRHEIKASITSYPGELRIGLMATADNADPVTHYIRVSIRADLSGFNATAE
jgi:hypothetical protein